MSYILDALKKSEQERKRGDVPGLQTVHVPIAVEQKSPRMLYVLIILLMLLLAFLVGLMMAGRQAVDGEQAAVVLTEERQQRSIATSQEPTVKLEQQPSQARLDKPSQALAPLAEEPSITRTAPTHTPASSEPVYVSSEVKVSQDKELAMANVPYLHELEDYKQQSIPRLNFAGHVYSSSALNRSVIINGHAMSEGDSIIQGLHVEQITPRGVVFGFQGEYFRVDILQDWSFE